MSENVVTRWFGGQFARLHPLIQDLHRHGGRLSGEVEIETGQGLGAAVGRRLAKKLGVPLDRPRCGFEVEIRHTEQGLLWSRHFAGGNRMVSVFEPVGHWPDGHWVERTGPITLILGVEVIDGGWHWQPRAAKMGRLPVPLWLLPRSHAYKRIEDGRYRFSVSFSLPVLGVVLSYRGLLAVEAGAARGG